MQYWGKRVCTGNAEVQPKFASAKLIIFLHERAIPAGKKGLLLPYFKRFLLCVGQLYCQQRNKRVFRAENGQNGSVKGLDYYI